MKRRAETRKNNNNNRDDDDEGEKKEREFMCSEKIPKRVFSMPRGCMPYTHMRFFIFGMELHY
jgi:hypothetical protein